MTRLIRAMRARPLEGGRSGNYSTLIDRIFRTEKCLGGIEELSLRMDIRWFINRHVAGSVFQE